MSYLLDTCVVSEFAARQPSEKVIEWLSGLDPESAFISVVTVGEIQKGIDKLSPSKRKDALREWAEG
jgi:tRNA(fMet)-specific endonuclease VapC